MILLLLAALFGVYDPGSWLNFPAMDDVRCISASSDRLYIAVPKGVYILDRSDYRPVRTLTSADGITGEVRLAAFNPARGDLLVATDDRLYQYISTFDRAVELFPPFRQVRSIGIATDAAYFDTEKGLFRKERLLDRYEQVQEVPENTTWYGRLDTSRPEDYVFLVPYYLTDNQLNNHRMTAVYRDPRGRRLYVAARGYGVTVYSLSLGLPQHQIRMGPSSGIVNRIIGVDDELWFSGLDWTVSVDPQGSWSYVRTKAGDLAQPGTRLFAGSLLDLGRKERIRAMLPDSLGTWVGTDEALYSLGSKGKLTRVTNFGLPVNGLALFGDSLLVGTDAGLYLVRKDSLSELQDPFNRTGFGVYSVAQADGRLWLGTVGGIVLFDRSEVWQHIIPPGFDLSKPVRGLTAWGSIVFYDNGSGITAYDAADTSYTTFDTNSGLPEGDITSMYADDRYLWIAFPGLISRFEYKAELR